MLTKKAKRWPIIALVVLFLVVGAAAILLLPAIQKTQKVVTKFAIVKNDASQVPDGIFVGEYDAGLVYAKAEVTVREGQIAGIKLLEHRNGRGAAADKIVDEIVAAQRLDVDAVAGATISSRVIQKAVEHALSGGITS